MKTPSFQDPQFLDASGIGGLLAAFGTVSGSIASAGSGSWATPGFVAPEAATFAFSGMVATTSLPRPWGLVSSGGAVVRAHGTATGADTTSYANDFTPLIPGSGSVVAYLVATVTSILQDSFPVPGPPPGHPSYNPTYIPSVGYASNVMTVSLTATTGVVDNVNTFEIFRTTLTAGQSALSVVNTVGQQRAANQNTTSMTVLPSGGVLSAAQAQVVLAPAVSGLTHTLPAVKGAGGLTYRMTNPTNGNWTIATSGLDVINGTGSSGVSSFVVPPSGSVSFFGDAADGIWQTTGFSPSMAVSPNQFSGSIGTSGWQKFPTGFMMQWGSFSGTTGSTFAGDPTDTPNIFVPFSVNFPHAALHILATPIMPDPGPAGVSLLPVAYRTALSASGALLRLACFNELTPMSGSYLAIGW